MEKLDVHLFFCSFYKRHNKYAILTIYFNKKLKKNSISLINKYLRPDSNRQAFAHDFESRMYTNFITKEQNPSTLNI